MARISRSLWRFADARSRFADTRVGDLLSCGAGLCCEQRAHGVDRIGLRGRLVGAVALQAREAKREAARVVRALLQVVERDFGNEFRTNVYDMTVASGFAREQLGGLPFERRVGQALERLAEHHEPAARRIARAQMQVRKPGFAAARAPLIRD